MSLAMLYHCQALPIVAVSDRNIGQPDRQFIAGDLTSGCPVTALDHHLGPEGLQSQNPQLHHARPIFEHTRYNLTRHTRPILTPSPDVLQLHLLHYVCLAYIAHLPFPSIFIFWDAIHVHLTRGEGMMRMIPESPPPTVSALTPVTEGDRGFR